MWTKIFLFLWIVGTIKQRSTSIQIDCAKRVQRCPVGKEQWAQKSEELQCRTNYGYVCLRDSTGYLYESCMADFTVQANTGNCPVLFCNEKKPHLGTENTFYHCPEEVSGCPPKNHPGYRIHHLYKYPKCAESSFSAEIENTSPRSTKSITMDTRSLNDVNRQDNTHVVILIVCFALLFVVVGSVIGYIVYSKMNDYSYVTSDDTEGTSKEQKEHVQAEGSHIAECDTRIETLDDQGEIIYYRSKQRSQEIPGFCLSRMEGNGNLKSEELRCWIQSINESVAGKVRILPLKEDDTIEIDRIYVPGSIVDENEICTSGITDKQTKSEITPEKMFYIKPGKPARFIFLLGDAGYGKTVQCQRIAKSWCEAWKTENLQSKKQGNTEKEKELERSLKEFDFLFFVPMRDLNNKHSCVDDMLYDYYRRFDTSHQHLADIRAVLQDKRYKCLVILDGLDEWNISESMKGSLLHKGIPNCEGLPSCTFLITMRSWRFMEVDPICRQGLFDKVVRLHGLDDEGIEELTSKILCSYFNKDRNSDKFLKEYKSVRNKTSSVLKSLMKIPLLALFCILTLHENIETGHSLTTLYLSIIEALMKRYFKREQIGQKRGYDTESSVPGILKDFFHVTSHMPDISHLGQIAFKNLASQGTDFVISDVQSKNPEVKETLNFFTRIGLLCKHDASGQIYEDNVRYSFLHKTIQEFLYSLHLVYNKSEERIVECLCNEISDIEKALDLSTVLTFVSGLSPAVGCNISRYIDELSSEDKDIHRFRAHFATETYNKVFHLYNLQLSCYREVREWRSIKDFQNSGLVYYLSDVILLGNDMDKLTIRESADVLRYHANNIKSLCMKFIPNDSVEGITNIELTEFLHKSDSLEALDIDGYDRGKCRLFDDSSKRIPCLRTLGLFNVAFADNILTDFLTKDESRRRINALGLFYIRSADDLDVDFEYEFSSVHRLGSVRSGYLQKRIVRPSSEITTKCMKEREDKKPLLKAILEVLPEYHNLSTLHVSYMDSEEDRKMLLQVLPDIQTLKHFGYDGSSVYLEPNDEYDTAVINVLLKIKQLRILFLNNINLNEKVLKFETLSQLQRITLEVIKMNASDWSTFVSSVSKIKTLRKVALNDTNIDDKSYEKLSSLCSLEVVMDGSTEWTYLEKEI